LTSHEGSKRGKSSRITENDFDPLTRQIAIAAKFHFRLLVVYDDPFPPQGGGRFEYGWNAIKTMVKKSNNPKWQSALKWANGNENPERPLQIVKFVGAMLPGCVR